MILSPRLALLFLGLCAASAWAQAPSSSQKAKGALDNLSSPLLDISELAQRAQSLSNDSKTLPAEAKNDPAALQPKPSGWAPDSRRLLASVELSLGNRSESILIELYPDQAPRSVERFRQNCESGAYDSTAIHRAISGFLVQMGDPLTKDGSERSRWGTGGEESTLEAEIGLPHRKGSLSMARRSNRVNPAKRSNGSQFFVALGHYAALDGQYSVFGQIVDGIEVLEKIAKVPVDGNDCPLARIEITSCRVFDHVGPWNRSSEEPAAGFAARREARGFWGRLLQRIW
jgi:cyclophilin family peptidyl-prolyl cis-trans isomerase